MPDTRIGLPQRLFLVMLVFVLHVVLLKTVNAGFAGDELRYIDQAERLMRGESPYPREVIKNPPLYPAFLAVLLKIGASAADLKLASVIATVVSVSVLLSLLARVCTAPWAIALSALYALYPPMLMLGSQVMTEPFAALLLLLTCRLLLDIRDFHRPGLARLLVLSLVLASLAMFKPIFGYALAAACCIVTLLYFARAWGLRRFYRWIGTAALLAIVLCTPYLAYVHSVTGSRFSWGTTGGEHLYWMTVSGEDVWGSWVAADKVDDIDFLVRSGHAAEVATAEAMSGGEAQIYYTELGAQRLRENPQHFVRNVIANGARVLFNYPFSFRPQSLYTYAYLLPNMTLYVPLGISFALLWVTWRWQHPGMVCVVVFCVIYLAGNTLAGSTGRQGVALVGPWLLWLAIQARLLIDAGVLVPSRARRMRESADRSTGVDAG